MLAPEEQIILNAHGPFLSPWSGNGFSVLENAEFVGRSNLIVETVTSDLKANFSLKSLGQFSYLDMACYCGYFAERISAVGFKSAFACDPRPENLERGEVVRRLLKLPTNANYFLSDLEQAAAAGKKYDVVSCFGLIHHVPSSYEAIKQLVQITDKQLYIESLVLNNRNETDNLKEDLELKDLCYQNKDELFGVTGVKYETNYFSGSSSFTTAVQISSINTIKMQLTVLGCKNIQVLVGEEKYRNSILSAHRNIYAAILTADTSDCQFTSLSNDTTPEKYERQFLDTFLDPRIVDELLEKFLKLELLAARNNAKENELIINESIGENKVEKSLNSQIISALKYSPVDKLSIEKAKSQIALRKNKEAIAVLDKYLKNQTPIGDPVTEPFFTCTCL